MSESRIPSGSLRPLGKRSLSRAVFEELRDGIIGGELAPESFLPSERALAEQLGVNRGAVREGLKRLEQLGLVSIQHGGATRVLDFRKSAAIDLLADLMMSREGRMNLEVARSLIELRDAVSGPIAKLAARRGGPETASALRTKLAEIRAATGEPGRVQDLRWEFWVILAAGSKNIAYRLLFNTLHELYGKGRRVMEAALGSEFDHAAHLEELQQAVERGDEAAAERAALAQIRPVSEALLKAIDSVRS